MKKKSKLIIKDPLYKNIVLLSQDEKYLDLLEFQRLRYIKQLSFVDFVFPSANHTRFTHSIGTYRLMRKVLRNSLMKIDIKTKKNLRIAALLHDLGHGPFSHLWENIFPGFDHEEKTREILKKYGLNDVADILDKKNEFYPLITSTIDVDKLDYMARDSYFSGVSYGFSEVEYILENLYVKDKKLIIKPKAISPVEDLITQRVNLFKSVYFHKFAVGYDFIFTSIFKRVRYLIENKIDIYVNKHIKSFFDKTNNIDDLIAINDAIIMSHIQEWSEHEDKILSNLCSMFLKRENFKIVNLKHKKIDVEKLRDKVAKKYDLNYYFCHVCIPINIIQTEIYVDYSGILKPLSEVSDLIEFHKSQKWNVEYVIFPKDVEYMKRFR